MASTTKQKDYDSFYNPITGKQVFMQDVWLDKLKNNPLGALGFEYDDSDYFFNMATGAGWGIERKDVGEAIQYYLTYGEMPSMDELERLTGRTIFNKDAEDRYYNITHDVQIFLKKNGIDDSQLKAATEENRNIKNQGYDVQYTDNGFVYKNNAGKAIDIDTVRKEIASGESPASKKTLTNDTTTIKLPDGSTTSLESLGAHKDNNNFFGSFKSLFEKGDDFKFNNALRTNISDDMVTAAANYYFSTGEHISLEKLKTLFPTAKLNDSNVSIINEDVDLIASKAGVDTESLYYEKADIREDLKNGTSDIYWDGYTVSIDNVPESDTDTGTGTGTSTSTPKEEAMAEFENNPYYTDVWSLQPGTTGYSIYNNLTNAERNAALSNMQLADAQYQNAAMQQAATVKSITDQVRSERMAKLRAGMNEAQIANQDMQMMMSNINAMNDQMNAMNYSNLQAQQQYNLAQDTAYREYLTNAQAMNQTAAAHYAAQSGDATYAANWLKNNPGKVLYYDKATGQYKSKDE